jgi:hypothetical protein
MTHSEMNARYYQNNKECIKAKVKKYYLENKEKIDIKMKEYRDSNKEKLAEKQRKYRKDFPDKRRSADLKRTFGITLEDYKDKLQEQNNLCAICRRDNNYKRNYFEVDHCHKTGKIRDLLCSQCNMGLGSFKDSPEIMKSAIDYINKHHGKEAIPATS